VIVAVVVSYVVAVWVKPAEPATVSSATPQPATTTGA
jgi:hypothetical protein